MNWLYWLQEAFIKRYFLNFFLLYGNGNKSYHQRDTQNVNWLEMFLFVFFLQGLLLQVPTVSPIKWTPLSTRSNFSRQLWEWRSRFLLSLHPRWAASVFLPVDWNILSVTDCVAWCSVSHEGLLNTVLSIKYSINSISHDFESNWYKRPYTQINVYVNNLCFPGVKKLDNSDAGR